MPRNTAAPRVARLRASASASASTVSRGTIIRREREGVDHRADKGLVASQASIIVEADEAPAPNRSTRWKLSAMPLSSG
jgi:hypothetical protein